MFRCRDLLTLPTMARAKLIVGEKGLENGIRWSYKAEDMNFVKWVHGQELLVVSRPVISDEKFELHKLIENAIDTKLSGVLLLVGEEYISSIAGRTLKLADDNSLPIFSLPGDVPLVDIFEELGHAIVFQEKKQLVNDDILAGIIFGNQIDPSMIESQIKILGYEIKGKQRGFMIHIGVLENTSMQEYMNHYLEEVKILFTKHESMTLVSRFHSNIVGITNEENDEILNDIFLQLSNSVEACQIGIGSAYEDMSQLNKSFSEAVSAIKYAKPVMWYEKMGFMKILLNFDNRKEITEYVDNTLGRIIEYDSANGTELLNTLISYFDCDENMKAVGAKLYIHPNTVKYRLQQIQEITGLNLFKTYEKIELYNALQCMKAIV